MEPQAVGMGHTVVRHDNPVHAGVHRGVGILDRQDAFEHDGAIPVLAQERDVLPRAKPARVGLLQPPGAEREGLARLLVPRRETRAERVQVERERGAFVWARRQAAVRLSTHEDRVGRADLHADARGEGQVRRVEVVLAPAEEEGVERDDERGEACHFGAAQERECHLVRAWPARVAWGWERERESVIAGSREGGDCAHQ